MDRISIIIIFGGRSGEHEVSVRSAASVIAALDPRKYQVTPVKIEKSGRWVLDPSVAGKKIVGDSVSVAGRILVPDPRVRHLLHEDGRPAERVDVVFPLVHGTFGEDGCLQGLLDLAELPYIGSGVLGSAVNMDKIEQKHLLEKAGFPVVGFTHFRGHEWATNRHALMERVAREIGFPNFVKPANLGSSVGISRVDSEEGLPEAVEGALRYDERVIVEKAVCDCREIECSVLGNDRPRASVAGEVIPSNDFYDYAAKYVDDDSKLVIPADLPERLSGQVRDMAARAFSACCVSGYARVDFLIDGRSGDVYLNELNTVPGFTSISMYPKLWEASGLAYADLMDELIRLALERSQSRKCLVRDFSHDNEAVAV